MRLSCWNRIGNAIYESMRAPHEICPLQRQASVFTAHDDRLLNLLGSIDAYPRPLISSVRR